MCNVEVISGFWRLKMFLKITVIEGEEKIKPDVSNHDARMSH